MASLGSLDAGGCGVLANIVAAGHKIVDASRTPDDGKPRHSHHSIRENHTA
jgi:hypothetical protein